MDLSDAHVLITGASRGIGAAMADEFAAAGARVSVAARTEDALKAVADRVGGTAFTVDLLDAEQVDGLIPRVEAEAGPIDVLVNNAGLEPSKWFHATAPGELRDILRVNLEASAVLTNLAVQSMLKRQRGHIVFVSSIASTAAFPGTATYGATKAAITHLGNSIRMELRATPLGVTVVSPGPVDNEMWHQLETAPGFGGLIHRLNMLRLIPTSSEEWVAQHTVDAVIGDHRHVRAPRRLAANHWLREFPTRVIEKVLIGVALGPNSER